VAQHYPMVAPGDERTRIADAIGVKIRLFPT
jgi:hypothetical protein